MGFGFFPGFDLFGIMFTLMFVLMFVMFIVVFAKMILQWTKDNNSPRLTVPAVVVAKRTNVSHRTGHNHHTHRSTSYHVTFQVESGDRMELSMAGHEFGLLVEGDRGRLTFQGSRYLGFERT